MDIQMSRLPVELQNTDQNKQRTNTCLEIQTIENQEVFKTKTPKRDFCKWALIENALRVFFTNRVGIKSCLLRAPECLCLEFSLFEM